ncbi:hypothetical protein [Bowdeniella massiliensis]|uniref:hypothetical protein n=1 Tax=Bowdeniella massiliensis TaxID=2932264 RepID=UPI002028FF71|nr:hypothetical protein [Bowdeniella massiliensis]
MALLNVTSTASNEPVGLHVARLEPIFLLGEPPPAIGGIRDDHAAQSNPPIFVDVRRKEA